MSNTDFADWNIKPFFCCGKLSEAIEELIESNLEFSEATRHNQLISTWWEIRWNGSHLAIILRDMDGKESQAAGKQTAVWAKMTGWWWGFFGLHWKRMRYLREGHCLAANHVDLTHFWGFGLLRHRLHSTVVQNLMTSLSLDRFAVSSETQYFFNNNACELYTRVHCTHGQWLLCVDDPLFLQSMSDMAQKYPISYSFCFQDIDECVEKRHRECTNPWMYIQFFCGTSPACFKWVYRPESFTVHRVRFSIERMNIHRTSTSGEGTGLLGSPSTV